MADRPCAAIHPDPAQTADRCRLCHLTLSGHVWPDYPRGNCRHLGAEVRQVLCSNCAGRVRIKVLQCKIHGECTSATPVPGVPACCALCGHFQAVMRPLRWVSTAELMEAAAALATKLPPDIDAVCGIPRSGMLPASWLAVHLHLPLYELPDGGELHLLGWGSRGNRSGFAGRRPKKLLLVDDTAYSGAAMVRASRGLAETEHVRAAAFANPLAVEYLDYYGQLLDPPHVLAWNIWNAGSVAGQCIDREMQRGIATDMDGVLCSDPDCPDADGGPSLERYLNWLDNAPPLNLPRALPVPLIVTARLECWRARTEAWLEKWGVKCKRLVMHPAKTASQRDRMRHGHADYKAEHFKKSGLSLFVESCPAQAERIHQKTGMPTLHLASGRVWQ